jgi:hypothetical protein
MSFTEPVEGAPAEPVASEPQAEPQNVAEAIARLHAEGPIPFVAEDDEPAEVGEPTAVPAAAEVAPAAPHSDAVDPFAEFGGRAAVEQALAVQRGLGTVDGAKYIAGQALVALGKSPEAVQAFMDGTLTAEQAIATPTTEPVASDPFADLGDDDVIDGATAKTLLAQVRAEAVEAAKAAALEATKPLTDQANEQAQQRVFQARDAAVIELLAPIGDDGQKDITQITQQQVDDLFASAGAYIDPDNWDPQHVVSALRRGHADQQARAQRAYEAYVAGKREHANGAPTGIGGGQSSGSDPVPEPANTKGAAQQARELYPELFG